MWNFECITEVKNVYFNKVISFSCVKLNSEQNKHLKYKILIDIYIYILFHKWFNNIFK